MHRVSVLASALVVAVLLASHSGNGFAADEVTGCLSTKGKLSKIALGGSPAKPCKGGETQISIGGDPVPGPTGPEGPGGPEGPPGPGNFLVRDGDGGVVGAYLSAPAGGAIFEALVVLEIEDIGGLLREVLVKVVPTDIRDAVPGFALEFESDDCSGPAWARTAGSTVTSQLFFEPATIANHPPGARPLYVAFPDEAPTTIFWKSTLIGRNLCEDITGIEPEGLEDEVIPTELLHLDLLSEFPAPFTLESQ